MLRCGVLRPIDDPKIFPTTAFHGWLYETASAQSDENVVFEHPDDHVSARVTIVKFGAGTMWESAPPAPVPVAAPVLPATGPAPAEGAKIETVSEVQPQPTGGETLGDAAKQIKQHKACLELAKDNPHHL